MGVLSVDIRQAVRRLSTHEDAAYGHAHKVLGVSVLASFCYRGWLWWTVGSMGFDGDGRVGAACWTVLLHAMLHVTSFQFVIGSRRNRRYNVIWPEMRWHTAIFAGRSLAAMALLTAAPSMPWLMRLRPAVAIATMLLADAVTARYSSSDGPDGPDGDAKTKPLTAQTPTAAKAKATATATTTMRGNPYPEGTPKRFIHALNLFYSVSQAGATLAVISSTSCDTVFWLLLPIQTAPLLMTLVKKGVIDQAGWHLWYSLALLSNFGLQLRTRESMSDLEWYETAAALLAFAVWRIGMRGDKYVFWIVLHLVNYFGTPSGDHFVFPRGGF
jgi:hypothetical protein